MNAPTPQTRSPLDDAADQAVAVLLMECVGMNASQRTEVLGKVTAQLALSTESDILTPRTMVLMSHHKALGFVREARNGQ